MPILLPAIAFAGILGLVVLWLLAPRAIARAVTAIFLSMFLFLVFLFCIFGFAASYELSNWRLLSQMVYATIGLICLGGAALAVWKAKKR